MDKKCIWSNSGCQSVCNGKGVGSDYGYKITSTYGARGL